MNAAAEELSNNYYKLVQKKENNDNPTLQRLLPAGNTLDSN